MRDLINLVESIACPARAAITDAMQAIGGSGQCRMKVLNDTTIELEHIEAYERGQGQGSAMMRAICSAADRYGATIELMPRSYQALGSEYDDALDQDDLEGWYSTFGFDQIPNRSGDGSLYDEHWSRPPQGDGDA